MTPLLKSIVDNKLLWLLVFVPIVFVVKAAAPENGTLLFVLAIAAIVPLAALLSTATESVAARTGDSIGGLLNATLGNLTELIIAISALSAGQYMLVKASLVGAIVSNTLFMMGAAFLIGGLRHKVQEFNVSSARLQVSMLLLATFSLMVPSAVASADTQEVTQTLSLWLSALLILVYGLGLFFSLVTHRQFFSQATSHDANEVHWPVTLSLTTLAGVTVLVALVAEIFIESLTEASEVMGLSPAFVGFVVVALVGAAAEMASAFSAAAKNRLDLSIGIGFGSAAQIALFVAPALVILSYFIGPQPMSLQFWPGAVVMMFMAVLTAALVTHGGRSAWFLGVLMLTVYLVFAMTLYLMPTAAP